MDKIAVVTGGSSGMGKYAAEYLSKMGCTVYELSRRGTDCGSVRHITADVTDEESVNMAVTQVIREAGHIDILLNNAGFGISGAVEYTPLEEAQKQLDVNFWGILNFSSYNYAGMSGRPETVAAAQKAAAHYGCSASASRLLGGEKPIHKELEKALAKWKNAEDAVVLVGGHSTNVTIVGNFCGKNDLILYDVLSHNSIHEGTRLSEAESRPFPHNNYEALEAILKSCRQNYAKVLIVVEGVYSMDGDIAPIPEFVRIKKEYGCFLMVDEAHSSCVLGEHGGGVDEYFRLGRHDIDIRMGTLSKGLGTCGGYLAGDHALIEYLRYNLPGFVFSVGISPPLAAATLEAIRLLQVEPSIMQDLHRNIRCFLDEAHKRHFNTCLAGETAILPILVGDDEEAFRLSMALLEKGVFAPSAVYPAVPKGKARLRFCVISEHKPEQIIYALDALQSCAAGLGIWLPE